MRVSRPKLAFVWAVMTGLVGCGGSTPPPAPPEATVSPEPAPATSTAASESAPTEQKPAAPEKPDVPPAGAPLERIMQAHFKDALLIRQAVIAGKPEDAVDPAFALTRTGDLDHLPEGWRGFVERMQEVAGRIKDSTLVSRAAAATADLGVSCGMCHQQRGGPQASKEPAPAEGTTVESRMQRHVWATERLWEGLYVPSDDAWNAGARALSSAPFPSQVLKDGGVYARSAAGDFARLVAKAPAKRIPRDRAELYAELLLTCGSCHQAIKATH
jgi:hypothetical protein